MHSLHHLFHAYTQSTSIALTFARVIEAVGVVMRDDVSDAVDGARRLRVVSNEVATVRGIARELAVEIDEVVEARRAAPQVHLRQRHVGLERCELMLITAGVRVACNSHIYTVL